MASLQNLGGRTSSSWSSGRAPYLNFEPSLQNPGVRFRSHDPWLTHIALSLKQAQEIQCGPIWSFQFSVKAPCNVRETSPESRGGLKFVFMVLR